MYFYSIVESVDRIAGELNASAKLETKGVSKGKALGKKVGDLTGYWVGLRISLIIAVKYRNC